MASYTTNLNLKKPAGSENVAIGDINNNMDTIDTAYGTLNNKLTKVSYLTKQTATIAPGGSSSIVLDVPTATEILAVIPCADPDAHYNSALAFRQFNLQNNTLTYYCIGSGNSQTFTIKYHVLYRT